MSLDPKQQLDWCWSRKAEIEYNKFFKGLKPKKLPYDRITISLLRKFHLSNQSREALEHFDGRKKLKNLDLPAKSKYFIYKDLNSELDNLIDGPKEYVPPRKTTL